MMRTLVLCGLLAATAAPVTARAAPDAAAPRDPFAPPPPAAPGTPLERLDPRQLRLVALVYAPARRALLEDEAGLAHLAAVGTRVGPRGGTVVAIERGMLRIRDAERDVVLALAMAGTSAEAAP